METGFSLAVSETLKTGFVATRPNYDELLFQAMSSCVEMCEQLYPVLQQSLISAMKAKSKDTT